MSVRNLRAMFENKTQESPPDRGRSPGVSSSANESISGTESPRPLSKVRTSFVAIEKDGRIGLQQRDPSEASSVSGRKLSQDTEAGSSVHPDNISTIASSTTTTSHAEPPKETASLAPGDPPKGLAASPQIKEDPRARKSDFGSHSLKSQDAVGPPPSAGEQEKKTNGVKAVEAVGTPARSTPAASETPAKPAGDDVKKVNGANGVNAAEASAKSTPAKSTPAASARPAVSAAPERVPVTKPSTGASKPAAVSAAPARKVTDKELVMSPDPVPQPRAATRPANNNTTTTTTSHPPTTPKAARASTTDKKAVPASVSPGGFVKPRPKSPTRPVKLPASLTTHTTASGSRSRVPSGSVPPPPSHENNSARSASRTKALGRSSSAAGRQRPSFGPPPKQPAKDHPVAKKDAKVDEGFLARMMRPTQASASKKNEKVPVTPPRRPAAGVVKKSASAKSVPAARRPAVSKSTSAATSAAPSPERVVVRKESSSLADRDIATAVEDMSIAVHDDAPPRTPEREATIAEELEEDSRPGEAGALADGDHHHEEAEAEGPAPVDDGPGGNGNGKAAGALDEEETW
ncbi:hypothetical protein KVR01_013188 [Diaporthe batatas]|uniref:uncharacterized protein n=1 Tax=Diaporthe batatas TaxID=748121 RepID=UPI001D046427|nr:uncharacterized protein KVR01_013188 [Diaporthe batatas]KAG8156966.1 hypothetical protein KVR01_013188 [Diaporthe batatas]